MTNFLHSSSSPYLALWYLFLAFFGIVMIFQLSFLVLRNWYAWRVRQMIKKHAGKPVA